MVEIAASTEGGRSSPPEPGACRIAGWRFEERDCPLCGEPSAAAVHPWDVVMLPAVLEHLYDPLAVLRRLKAALRPGGLVFIDVPNECSFHTRMGNLYQRLRGRNWAVNLSPTFSPFHVVGFCPRSLKHALGSIGLEIVALSLYRPLPCQATPSREFSGRLEDKGARAVLALEQALGGGGGINCWARRPEP